MGKPTGKKKTQFGPNPSDGNVKQGKSSGRASKAFDEDTAAFINMSHELKEEGNKLFQKRDHEGAMLKYEKALKLVPRNHIDAAYLRSNMAACYMQMGIGEYPRAINQCNLALEVAPKCSKALLKRARCYEALNRFDLALKDVKDVLSMEPRNVTALELADKVKTTIELKGLNFEDKEIVLPPEFVSPPSANKIVKEKTKRNKSNKIERKKVEKMEGKKHEEPEENKAQDKVVVEEKVSLEEEKVVTKTVKLVFGDDIRWAQVPVTCGIQLVRDVVMDRFLNLKGVLIKYKDQEGDLVTITTTDELRLAESLADPQGSLRLYIAEVSPDQEPVYEGEQNEDEMQEVKGMLTDAIENGHVVKGMDLENGMTCIEPWIILFAGLFKNHVGFDSDSYLDLHETGMNLYSEAIEDTVTSENAQELFEIAAAKFQEMTALALFNWGNVHLSRARKRVLFTEDVSRDFLLEQAKDAYEWAQKEYVEAGMRYEEALKIKPEFYEALLGLGLQQFEQAKLSWYYAIGSKIDLQTEFSARIRELYDKAEDSMERGMQMWEEEEHFQTVKYNARLQKIGLDSLFEELTAEEASEKATNMRSQIFLLWGTILYERSIMEFKLGLLTWEECLEVSVEKFELAGASPTDIAVMIKNHCSNQTASEGLGFEIDEIVHACHEMHNAKRWQAGIPSFRLQPLLRRRAPKLHAILEHV